MPKNAFSKQSARARAATPVAALAAAALVGCSSGGSELEGVDVPVTSVSLGEPLLLGDVQGVVPGEPAGLATPGLGQVGAGRFLPDGGFVLANGATTSLLLFDAMGAFDGEVTAAAAGKPPMERVHDVAVLADGGLLAWDRALKRISTFDRAGNLQGVTEVRDRRRLPADELLLLDSRRVAILHHEPPRTFPRGFSHSEVVVAIMNLDGEEAAQIGPLPGRALYGAARANILVPFGERFLASAIDGRLFVGDGVAPELLELAADGHPVRRISLPLSRAVISPADREAVLARYRRPTTSDAWMEALHASFQADFFPAFDRLVASSDGRLWLRRHGGMQPSSDWLAVDPARAEGRPLSLPSRSEVLDAAEGRVLVLAETESGGPEVRIFQLGDGS
jgi:hypothetical protein